MQTEIKNYIAIFKDKENAITFAKDLKAKSPKSSFKVILYRHKYYITFKRPSTARQKAAVEFCLDVLQMDYFPGDINDFDSCNSFLQRYLDICKNLYAERLADYLAYMWEKL